MTKQAMRFLLLFLAVASSSAIAAQTASPHPAGQFVTIHEAKIWVESEGSGEALILVAGGPGSAHYFHPQFSALADSYRVIYFDAFGRGKSDRAKSPAEYTFARDVDDLEELRKALGLEAINLFGHSYGGMVAQAYALKYPAAVKRLILADTFFSGEMWQANNDNYNHEARNQFPEKWERIEEVRARGFRSSDKEHQQVYDIPAGILYYYDPKAAVSGPFNSDVYYAIVGEDGDFIIGGDIAKLDFRRALSELKMPILILAGRYDRVSIPRLAVQYKRYAPQAEFVMFEKSGHMPFIEEPELTMQVLRAFLRK